ncbi:hypothetical protein ECTW09195_2271, partial [Escherichia coli TW09195]
MKEEKLKFWNPERITTTGKSLRITQIRFNIIYIVRTAEMRSARSRLLTGKNGNKP